MRLLLAILFLPFISFGQIFVDVNATGANNGTSEANAYTSAQSGIADAQPGDTVWIKAGEYSDQEMTTVRAGTVGSPIVIMGYRNSPGDIVATNGPTWGRLEWETQGFGTPPNNIMPHFEWSSLGLAPPSTLRIVEIDHQYVELHNVIVSFGWTNIEVTAGNVLINNCVAYKAGYWVPNQTGWNATTGPVGPYDDGYGIDLAPGSDGCTVTNSVAIDSGLANIFGRVSGSHVIRNCESLQYEPGAGTDYGFDFYGSEDNLLEDNYAKRYYTSTIGHRGRGLVFQNSSDNNIVRRLTSVNLKIQLEDSRNNYLEDLVLRGDYDAAEDNINYAGIQFLGGSKWNVFKRVLIENGSAIQFVTQTSNGTPAQRAYTHCGQDNYMFDFIVRNASGFGVTGIISSDNQGTPGTFTASSTRNYAINWVVEGDSFSRLVYAQFDIGDFTFYNTTFSDFSTTAIDLLAEDATGSTYDLNLINSADDPTDALNIFGSSNTNLNKTNFISQAPNFLSSSYDIGLDDPTLANKGTLPVISDGGGTFDYDQVVPIYGFTDYYGNVRPQGADWDIGIFEAGGESPPVDPPTAMTDILKKKKFIPVN